MEGKPRAYIVFRSDAGIIHDVFPLTRIVIEQPPVKCPRKPRKPKRTK